LVIKLSMLCVEVKVEYSKVKVRIRLILKLYFLSNPKRVGKLVI